MAYRFPSYKKAWHAAQQWANATALPAKVVPSAVARGAFVVLSGVRPVWFSPHDVDRFGLHDFILARK